MTREQLLEWARECSEPKDGLAITYFSLSGIDRFAARIRAMALEERDRGKTFISDDARDVLIAALQKYYDFHHKYDTREQHRKRCSVWTGLKCDCGSEEIEVAIRGLKSKEGM